MRPAADIVRRLRELDANVVMGPPSVLRLLIREPEVANGSFHGRVKRIFSYAEVLDPHDRTAIAEAFGAPVVEIYQASEGLIACPCSHGSLHVNEDLVVLEALDAEGQPVTEPGVTCERTIITNLYNRVQPLIRYELNDLVAFGEPCPCGSGFRTIDRVVGRRDDVLEFEMAGGGSRPVFPDLVSRWIITATDDLDDYQVLQALDHSLVVRLLLPPCASRDEVTSLVRGSIQEHLGRADLTVPHIAFDLETEFWKPGPGKFKRFIREAG